MLKTEKNAFFDHQGICFLYQLRNIGENIGGIRELYWLLGAEQDIRNTMCFFLKKNLLSFNCGLGVLYLPLGTSLQKSKKEKIHISRGLLNLI